MQISCKNCKKHTENAFSKKKIAPISKNIIKEKSKCVICLTERTFVHEAEDKYDLKSKVYPNFFTDQCYKIKWRFIA